MTKVEIIEQIIATKKVELTEAYNTKKKYNDKVVNPGYLAITQKFFNGFTTEDVYVKASNDGESITFLRPCEESKYDKEVMNLRLRTDWRTEEITDLTTSVYSTSDNSLWELERLQLVGEVASIIIDFKDDFIAEMSAFKDESRPKSKELQKVIYAIEADITSCTNEINSIRLKIGEELLESKKGMVFSKDQLGAIDVSWDHSIRRIVKARIIKKTASGKSADLELTSQYGQETSTQVYEKVRMSNVETLLWQYRDYVLNA